MKRFRGGLVFEAHRRVYYATLDWRVMKKKHRMLDIRLHGNGNAISVSRLLTFLGNGESKELTAYLQQDPPLRKPLHAVPRTTARPLLCNEYSSLSQVLDLRGKLHSIDFRDNPLNLEQGAIIAVFLLFLYYFPAFITASSILVILKNSCSKLHC